MYISEASKVSGATVKAIRLYDQLGLLNVARVNSYRVFSAEDILLIKFIKLAQNYDFTLSEIRKVIGSKKDKISWQLIRNAIEKKEKDIAKEIERLQGNKRQLHSYNKEIAKCLTENEGCRFP